MSYEDFIKDIIITGRDGINGRIVLTMWYGPKYQKGTMNGFICEKSFSQNDKIINDTVEPYIQLWNKAKTQIDGFSYNYLENYFFNKIVG